MPSEKVRKVVESTAVENEIIKIRSTNPELTDKIKLNVQRGVEPVRWYIRFNIPLNGKTASKKTMNVTDTNGYIVETEISYDSHRNMIVITPVDVYAENQYYLLNIGKDVESKSNQSLKREIHILFKLLGNEISEYTVLKHNVIVPPPRPRPKDWRIVPKEQRGNTVSRAYSLETTEKLQRQPMDRLPYARVRINFIVCVAGIAVIITGMILSLLPLTVAGLALSLLGALHMIFQLSGSKNKSAILYNLGVIRFNRGNYKKSFRFFERACAADRNNELAEYAASKVKFFV